jgi:hypothetical protein
MTGLFSNKKSFLPTNKASELLNQNGITTYQRYIDWPDRPANLPSVPFQVYGSFTILLSDHQRTRPIPDHWYIALAFYNSETYYRGWWNEIERRMQCTSVRRIVATMKQIETDGFVNLRRPHAGRLGREPRASVRVTSPITFPR